MVTVQIFGLKNSSATRAAERFFKERRTAIQFVDLKQKPMAPGEIKRFIERFGLVAAIKEIVSEMRRRIAFDVMDLDILDRALGFWSSDDNDAPHVAIATLRERLRALRKP